MMTAGGAGTPTSAQADLEEDRMGINKDQIEGRAREAAGKVQESAGQMTGNRTAQAKGMLKKAAGAAQAGVGDLKEDLRQAEHDRDRDLDRGP
jgi:uncharacterized protein YjbJ (UPF0337 family)